MPIFFPVIFVAVSVFFEISGDKKEYGDNAGLQIAEVEPFLRLWQMTKHDGYYRKCFRPINPVDSLHILYFLYFSAKLQFFL
jgi:hypothetical protein